MRYKRSSPILGHVVSPKFWLFRRKLDFFNSHACSRQLCCEMKPLLASICRRAVCPGSACTQAEKHGDSAVEEVSGGNVRLSVTVEILGHY
jgi:hypothetical protein